MREKWVTLILTLRLNHLVSKLGFKARFANFRSFSIMPPPTKSFDMSRYRLRHIALHIAYLGTNYYGFASQEKGGGDLKDVIVVEQRRSESNPPSSQTARKRSRDALSVTQPILSSSADAGINKNNNHVSSSVITSESSNTGQKEEAATQPRLITDDPFPTIESLLFMALTKACLVDSRSGAGYTRCGRTDRGVSSGGQVVSLRIRSRALRFDHLPSIGGEGGGGEGGGGEGGGESGNLGRTSSSSNPSFSGCCSDALNDSGCLVLPSSNQNVNSSNSSKISSIESSITSPTSSSVFWSRSDGLSNTGAPFPSREDEIDYVSTLNSILPSDIRVLGWTDVPENFSARFSATLRTYRYYFIRRDLDLDAMRRAGDVLTGVHDFRNVCKIDIGNTQNFVREILSVKLILADPTGSTGRNRGGTFGYTGPMSIPSSEGSLADSNSPISVYYIEVIGRAFLWHQIRCVAALLFHVGRGVETVETVQALLDISRVPARPQYPMAKESPLILQHCGFGEEDDEEEDEEEEIKEEVGDGMKIDSISTKSSSSSSSSFLKDETLENIDDDENDETVMAGKPINERRERYSRSFPNLHSNWFASVSSIRKITTDLEEQWSEAVIKAAMLRGILDRVYSSKVRIKDVEKALSERNLEWKEGHQHRRRIRIDPLTQSVTSSLSSSSSSLSTSLPNSTTDSSISSAPEKDATMTWAQAVDAFGGGRRSEGELINNETITRASTATPFTLFSPADIEYRVAPPLPSSSEALRTVVNKGFHVPLLSRATGKGVEEKWKNLSPSQRAEISRLHPVNAPLLDLKTRATTATTTASATTKTPKVEQE